ncbi:MAG: DUF885 domain-containing protein [Verrucomicrobia bacterium]|nr:DUF885 domain-containing protein [Verrucomicrobiota bacterium]
MKFRISIKSVVALLLTCISVCAALANTNTELDAIFSDYLDAKFRMQPLTATYLGDHRFDHLLDDLSSESRDKWTELDRATLGKLRRQIDFNRLSKHKKIDYRIFEHELKESIWMSENLHPFKNDPRTYNSYISDSVYLPLSQSTLPKEQNVTNVIARMKQIPGIIVEARKNLENPPRVKVETAIKQNRGAIEFYKNDIYRIIGDTRHSTALESAANSVVAALEDYDEFLENELLPKADGEWRLGADKFAQKFDLQLGMDMSPGELLAAAESEFEKVEYEMYIIARQLWGRFFPEKPMPPDDTQGRRKVIKLVLDQIASNHSTPETIVGDVRSTVSGIKEFIESRRILHLPDPDRCNIIEMPEFQRGNSTAYMNSPPPLDPNADAYFAVSPPPSDWSAERIESFFEEYNHYMIQILAIHEAYPGHYVQFEYANEHASAIRRILGSGVYIEGWAVYTEQTMLDQGYGDGSPALRLTQLKFYLRAVGNAILDHKMHCGDMTDEEAMRLLVDRAFQSEGEARLKVIRSKQSACQLSTYFAGRKAMDNLRRNIQNTLNERFDLSEFNEAVLRVGPVPVRFLPELVRRELKIENQ